MSSSTVAINHQAAVELSLCKLHYDEVSGSHPDLLQIMEVALDGGSSLEDLKSWIDGMKVGDDLSHKFYSAARWYEASRK